MSVMLQVCAHCGAVQYPSREVCRVCLSDDLVFASTDVQGRVSAAATIHRSLDPQAVADGPVAIGIIATGLGVRIVALLAPGLAPDDTVHLHMRNPDGLIEARPEAATSPSNPRGCIREH